MEIKYLEWNLHAMGGNGYEIPQFVVSYLKTADVFVLTEFCQKKGWEDFQYALEGEYDIYCSPYSTKRYNQICIGIRKAINKKNYKLISVASTNISNINIPEFLQVDVEIENTKLSIIGIRIKTEGDSESKDKQYDYLKEHLQRIKKEFICLGDFNCTCWTLANKLDIGGNSFFVYGPRIKNGYFSYVFQEDKNNDGKNKHGLDWIIASEGIKVYNNYPDSRQSPIATYDWNFVTDGNGYIGKTNNDYLNIKGLPDHAILKGMINIS